MGNELHSSNESLGHLWQTQAYSRQVRAEVISVPVSAYVPPQVIDVEPRVVEARDASIVIEHQTSPVPARSVAKSTPVASTTQQPAVAEPLRAVRESARRDVKRRGDERRTAEVRVRIDHATRAHVSRHDETSKAIRPLTSVLTTTAAAAPAKYDVRRPTAVRPVGASDSANRQPARTPAKHRATPRVAVAEAKRATRSGPPAGSVDVVA